MADGYQLRTEKKKNAIRQAAFELFAAYGIEKVSLAEIAKKAQVSPVSIYNYFGTKDELVKKVMFSFLEEEWNKQLALLRSDLPFPEKVKKMILDVVEWTDKWNKDIVQELISDDPEWRTMLEAVFAQAVPEWMQFIESGKAEGYIDRDLSVQTIMVYFNILKEMRLSSVFKEASADARVLEELTRIMFYGLLNRKADS